VYIARDRSIPRVTAAACIIVVHAVGIALGSALNPSIVVLELAEFMHVTRLRPHTVATTIVAVIVIDATIMIQIVIIVAVKISNRRGGIHTNTVYSVHKSAALCGETKASAAS